MTRWPLRAAIALALAPCASPCVAGAGDFQEFSTRGLPGSRGLEVRVRHPAGWKTTIVEDPMALAELRGPHGRLTGILQIGRGRQRQDIEALCRPERARSMLQGTQDPQTRVTDIVARRHADRPAFEVRYRRNDPPLLVRSMIVCLKDTRLVVSCGATGPARAALGEIEPVCARVLDSLAIREE